MTSRPRAASVTLLRQARLAAEGGDFTLTGATVTFRLPTEGPAALTVTLTYPDGTPIEGAVVTASVAHAAAEGIDGYLAAVSATTDANGEAVLELAPNTGQLANLR